MAVTNVFCSVVRIPEGSGSDQDGFILSGINASSALQLLRGGVYQVSVIGSTFGTVQISQLGPDQSTLIPLLGSAFAANGQQTITVPMCQVKVVIA